MPGVVTGNAIVREDISDAYLQSDVREAPVTSRIKTGEQLKNHSLFSWEIEQMDGRSVDPIPENKDVTDYESDQQFKLYNRAQKYWRTPHVSRELNEVDVTVADFGKYVKQLKKKTEEQKRDIEQRFLDDQDSRDDASGYQGKGAGMFINDAVSVGLSGGALAQTDAQTAIPPQFLTPTKQIYVGNLIDVNGNPVFDQEKLLDMIVSRYDSLGMTTETILYADTVLKRHVSKFLGKYQANVQGYTAIVRTPQEALDAKELALYGADIYKTDFGNIMVEIMQWAPKLATGLPSGRGYIFNFGLITKRPSGRWMTHQKLEDRGGGPRGLVESIIGFEYGDPRTHAKIDPVAIQGT